MVSQEEGGGLGGLSRGGGGLGGLKRRGRARWSLKRRGRRLLHCILSTCGKNEGIKPLSCSHKLEDPYQLYLACPMMD